MLHEGNGAQRQESAHRAGQTIEQIHAETVGRTGDDAATLVAAVPGGEGR